MQARLMQRLIPLGICGLVSSVVLEYYLVCVSSISLLSCHCSWSCLLSCRYEELPCLVRINDSRTRCWCVAPTQRVCRGARVGENLMRARV
jgi:hypothetical protein